MVGFAGLRGISGSGGYEAGSPVRRAARSAFYRRGRGPRDRRWYAGDSGPQEPGSTPGSERKGGQAEEDLGVLAGPRSADQSVGRPQGRSRAEGERTDRDGAEAEVRPAAAEDPEVQLCDRALDEVARQLL